ncbi:MAG: filamentous hemagglutinin N-terminal domain-containing protein [Phycisphaerales bacterium]|nr:filamentous hemagglutinin N-terminal domain-containing protein [Phycisphaerales bacterium]
MFSGKPFFTGSVVGVGLGRFLFAAGALAALTAPSLAGPEGQQVVAGSAKFAKNGNVTTITASNNSIINYSSFNIGARETVRFIQPNATSRVLNRVGGGRTMIDGSLQANGIVYILNPAGIFFGGHAVVNVGGLVAAAGTMTNSDFLGGVDRFGGLAGGVSNFGTVNGSSVALIGQYVENHGVVYTERGTVTMAAGDEVYMGPRSGGLYVKIKSDQPKGDRFGVDNSGTIVGGASLLSCGDMYSMAVRNTGSIRSRSIRVEGQGSGVVSVGGGLDASARGPADRGGRIEVTGEKVGVFGATVRADGPAGGGTVLIGGQYRGGAGVRAADATYVSPGSTLSADATRDGDGGRVIVWSDTSTRTYGDISARGSGSGSGGLVETSGKEFLDVASAPDVRAENGDGGRWLIDPRNVEIVADGTGSNNGAINAVSPFTPTGDDATLEVDLIQTALLGAGVTVEVNTGATGTQAGNITLSTTLDFNGLGTGDTLRLTAANDIILNGAISDSAAGGDDLSLQLIANNDAAGGGSVTVSQGINLAGGTFSSSGVDFADAASNIVALSFTLNHTGNVTLNNGSAVALNASTIGGNLTVTTSAGGITDNGTVTVGGNLSATTSGANDDINLGTLAVTGTVSANTTGATGDVTLVNATGLDLAAMSVGGNLTATATTGDVNDVGTVTVAGNLSATASGTNDDINLGTLAVTGTVSANTSGATGDVTLTNAGGLNLSAMTVGGDLAVTATTGGITDSGTVTVGGNLIATASGANADITLNELAVAGSVSGNTNGATGDVTIVNATALNLGAMTVGGNLSATATTGAITDSGSVAVGGNATLTTTQADDDIFADQLAVVGTIGLSTNGAAADATIVNATGINFAATSIGRNLTATATTGNITDAATVTVGSAGTFTTALADADINLGTADIGGLVSLTTSGSGGDATVVNALNIDFQTTSVGGSLVATASTGNITDTGTVTVGGSSTFGTSTSGASILLDNLAAAGVIIANTLGATGHVTLSNTGAVNLGASSIGGDLTVTAGAGGTGAITDSGTVTVGGNSSFTTTLADADIFLSDLATAGTIALSTNGTAADATIVNATGINFAASGIGRNLSATAGTGGITDGAAVTVGGNGTFTASAAGADITLDATAVGGTIAANTSGAGGDVTITHATAIDLAASNIGGGLTVVAVTGNITDSGTVTVGGNADFTTSQANDDIVVNQLAVAGTVGVHTNGATADALVTNSATLNLAASQVGRTLTAASTGGNITDAAAVTAGTSASFTTSAANADITLDTTSAPTISASTTGATGNATITGAAGVNLGASSIGGALTVVATTGNITDAATVTVGGNADFTTSQANDDITVDNLAVAGTVGVHTNGPTANATVVNATALNLAASQVGGNLLATATLGNVTDAGTLTVTGTAGFTASQAGADITVNQLAVGGAISVSTSGAGADATIVDASTLSLGASTVGGALTATATTGNLVDSAPVAVTGNATFTTSAANADISLAQTTVGGSISLNTTGTTGLATLIHNGSVDLAVSSVGGDLSVVVSNGNLTDSGLVTVGGAGNFTTTLADADINLGTLAVTGTISLSTAGTDGDAAIVNATGVDLGTSSIGDDLSVTANTGNISDSGIADVDGDAAFTALAGGITLDLVDVAGVLTLSSSGNTTIANPTAVVLQTMNVGGNLSVTATTGGITDAGTVTVAGTSTLTALDASDITVDQFSGTGAFLLTTGGNATLVNAIGTTLGTCTIAGNLAATATTGNLLDSGTVTFGGTGTFTTAQAGADINLDTLAGTGALAFATNGAGANATAVNATGVVLATSNVGGLLSVTATTGNVTDSGIVTTGQGASFTVAGAGADIILDQLSVTGPLGASNPNALGTTSLINAIATDLGASLVAGDLSVTATTGGMTDSGLVDVDGTADFIVVQAGQDITLNQLAVTGQITPSVNGAGADVTLVNATGVNIGAWNVPGNLAVTAATGNLADSGIATVGGNGSFTTSASGATINLDLLGVAGLIDVHTTGATGDATLVNATDIAFAGSTVGGDLSATATTGGISDGGAVAVSGDATFQTLGAAAGISLDQTSVGGAIHLNTAAGDATVLHTGDVDLGASAVTGTLTIIATGGSISDSGVATATGDGNFTAATADEDINLDQIAVGGALSLSTTGAGGNATIVNASAVDLNTSDIGGDLSVTASAGGITDSGVVTVGGATTLTVGAGQDITLDGLGVGDDFGGPVSVTNGRNVILMDQNDLALGDVTTTGSLTATAAGNLDTSSGDLSVATSAALTATAGDMTLGNLTTGTTLAATAGASITQSTGTIIDVATTTTLSGGTGATDTIALDQDENNFQGAVSIVSGGDVTVVDTDNLTVGGTTAGGLTLDADGNVSLTASVVGDDLSIVAGGTIGQSGVLTVGGGSTLSAVGSIALTDAANDFGQAVTVNDGAAVSLRDTNDLILGNVGVGAGNGVTSLTAQSDDDLSQAAGTRVEVADDVTLTAGADMDLTRVIAGSDAADSVTLSAGGHVTLDLVSAGNSVGITAGGFILESGAGDGGSSPDITAASATLTAVGGIGSASGAGAIETTVGTLTATNSGSGVINIAETDSLTLASVTNSAGAVTVNAGGAIQATAVTSSAAVTLDAAGAITLGSVAAGTSATLTAGGSITEIGAGDAGVDISAASATLTAVGGIGQAAGSGAIETALGTLTATNSGSGAVNIAESDGITLASVVNSAGSVSVTTGGGGAIQANTVSSGTSVTLAAGGAMTLGSVSAGTDATLTAGGSIAEIGAGDAGVDITAQTASLTASGGIGAASGAGAIETTVGTLTAANSGSGVVNISESDGITLASVVNTGGAVTVNAGGAVQATTVSSSAAATITSVGGLSVGSVSAVGGTVTLDAAGGSITEIGAGDAGNDVVGTTVVLIADEPGGTVGGGAGGALETAATNLTANAGGGITLANNIGAGTTAAALNTTSGPLTITNAGTLATSGTWTGDTVAIRAGDLQIGHDITSGGALTIGRVGSGTIGLGISSGTMTITGAEFAHLQGTNLTVGGAGTSGIEVGGVTAGQSQGITGLTTLNASDAGSTVTFSGASSFNRLVSSSAGATTLADGAGVTASLGELTITGAGGLVTQGDASLSAHDTLTLNGGLTGGGAGTTLGLRGSDLVLGSTVNVGAGDVDVSRSTGGTISLGAAGGGLRIDGGELSGITARELRAGGANVSGITVDGVAAVQSGAIGTVNVNAGAAGGVVTFTGGASTFRALSAAGAGGIQLGTDLTATNGSLSMGSAVTLGTDVSLTGSGISLQAVDSDGTARSLTLNSTGDSTTSLGAVGQGAALSRLVTNADGSTTLNGSVTTTQTLTLNDAVNLGADVTATNAGASGVTFGSSVTGPHDLTVNAAAGAASFGGNIALTGAAGGDGGSLGVSAQGDITIAGDVSTAGGTAVGVGRDAGSVTLASATGAIETGAVNAAGSDAASGAGGAGGSVTITAAAGDIATNGDITTSGGDGTAGGSAGDVTLAAGPTTTLAGPVDGKANDPDHIIRLGGSILADAGSGGGGAGGRIELGSGRTEVPSTATIVGSGGDAENPSSIDLRISGRDIEMGPNEKLISLGTLTLDATNSVVIGDLASHGDLVVRGESIQVRARPKGVLRLASEDSESGFGLDEGVDFVSGGLITFQHHNSNALFTVLDLTADSNPSDPNQAFSLAAGNLENTITGFRDANGVVHTGVRNLQFRSTDAEVDDFVSVFDGKSVFLDLNSKGAGIENVAGSLAGILPMEARPEVSQTTAISASQRELLRRLGITSRELNPDELIEFLVGVSLYDDYPTSHNANSLEDFTVAINRLPGDRVTTLLAAYEDVFTTTTVDPETGATSQVNRSTDIEASLGQALRRYRETLPEDATGIDPAGFRAYLESTPDETEALGWVRRLEAFVRQLKELGLGPKEERMALDFLLKPVTPRGIQSAADFERVLMPAPAETPAPAAP